jgi:superoxide dismutase
MLCIVLAHVLTHSQYLNAIWSVVNFEEAEARFHAALSGADAAAKV